jgi:hypothetical protein
MKKYGPLNITIKDEVFDILINGETIIKGLMKKGL